MAAVDPPTQAPLVETPTVRGRGTRPGRWRRRIARPHRSDRTRDEGDLIVRMCRDGGVYFMLIAGTALLLALDGQREMWFWFVQVLLVSGFFVVRWSGLTVRPATALAVVAVLEIAAVVLAWG